ncbi:MAG: hypothetical protein ABI288_11120 [Ginsengibacter sp.]
MKKNHLNGVLRNIFLFTGIVIIAFSFSSCAKKMTFAKSTVVPAAQGSVKIKSDKNKNSSINLSLENLAKPGDLTPPKKNYVVWMETASNGTKNIGSINTSSGLLSSKLKSSLKTVTPYKPTGFFITAEDDESITYPGSQVIMSTK